MLTKESNYQIVHAWREGNICTDYLANMGRSLAPTTTNVRDPPHQLKKLLGQDIYGVVLPRLVAM